MASARRRGAVARITLAVLHSGGSNIVVRPYRLGGFWPAADVHFDRDGKRYGSPHEASTWGRLARIYEDVYVTTHDAMLAVTEGQEGQQ